MSTTLVGIFDTLAEAISAKEKLIDMRIDSQSIRVDADAASETSANHADTDRAEESGSIGRFFSNLFGSDDDAADYTEAVRRGGAVLTVKLADDEQADTVSDLLEDCGAVDVDERVEQWKATGYVPPERASASIGDNAGASDSASASDSADKMVVVQEGIEVGKRMVQKGGVRVHRSVTETPIEQEVSLRDERAVIDRVAVDRPASAAEIQSAFQDKNIEIRETTEVPVVTKTARVTEEVSVGKKAVQRTETVRDTVRSTQIDSESMEAGNTSPGRSFAGQERRFKVTPYPGAERRASM